jgi:protein arginine kinase
VSTFDLKTADRWLDDEGPATGVVVSSRARYARNLSDHRFSPRAKPEELDAICAEIERAVRASEDTSDFTRIPLSELDDLQRDFLKECRLISAEMVKGGRGRAVFVSPLVRISVLVNEEDHLRLQVFLAGFRLAEVLDDLNDLDTQLRKNLRYAFHKQLGYLTACPTNVGTGLRVSVMMHLPALVMTNTIEEIVHLIPQFGLTVRGFYGENSEFLGDFFQISNEVTLGKSEERVCADLETLVRQVIEREEAARKGLFDEKRVRVEDAVWRAFGALTNSRMLSSRDALRLLSHLRLGIDQGLFEGLTHSGLNRLMVEVQPAHLRYQGAMTADEEERDVARAAMLRARLADIASNPN